MICGDCAYAADAPTEWIHPHDCECTCQHRPTGSWKGVKDEDGSEGPK